MLSAAAYIIFGFGFGGGMLPIGSSKR